MKTMLTLLGALGLFVTVTLANAAEIPFSPELETRLNGSRVNYPYDLKHIAHGVYDASVFGGVCGTDYTLFTMPANTVVTGINFYFNNRFSTTGGSGATRTNVYCGNYGSPTAGFSFLDNVELDGSSNGTGNGAGNTNYMYSGPTGLTAGWLGLGSSYIALSGVPCDVKVRTNGSGGVGVGGSGGPTINSGKFELYLEYVLRSSS